MQFSRALLLLLSSALFFVPVNAFAEREPVAGSLKRVNRIGFDDAVAGPNGERVVELYVRVLTEFASPVMDLEPTDFEIWHDDERIELDELTVQSLSATSRGITAVLAIDASGTMRGEPFDQAREAALSFLDKLRPEDRVAVLTFSEAIEVVSPFGAQRSETRQALRDLEIDLQHSRHTLLHDGAYRAIDLIRTATGNPRRAFSIIFSDGKDDGSDRTRDDVVQAAVGRKDQPHILNFSVGYERFGGTGLGAMRILAEETGGEYMQAVRVEEVTDFFDRVANQMTESYLISYATSMDGDPHSIRVTVGGQTGERSVDFPDIAGPIWPWLVAAAAIALVAGIVLVVRSSGSVGRLSIVSGSLAGTQVALRKGKTRIGALDDNDLILIGTKVSRYHAEVTVRRRQVEIADLDSTNGTLVNGQRVARGPLVIGDRIAIGDFEIEYQR